MVAHALSLKRTRNVEAVLTLKFNLVRAEPKVVIDERGFIAGGHRQYGALGTRQHFFCRSVAGLLVRDGA